MMQASPTGAMLDGRYEVRSVLGGGASAVVYLARQTRVDRDVAIKVIPPDSDSALVAGRLVAEARVVKLGRRLAVVSAEIRCNERPDPVAISTITYAIPD